MTLSQKATSYLCRLQESYNLPPYIKALGTISIHGAATCIKIPEAIIAIALSALSFLGRIVGPFSQTWGNSLREFSKRSYEYAICVTQELLFLAPNKTTTTSTHSTQKISSKGSRFFFDHKYALVTCALVATAALGYLYYYSYRVNELSSLPSQQKQALLDLFSVQHAKFQPCKDLFDKDSETYYMLSNHSCKKPESCCTITFRTPSDTSSATSSYNITKEEAPFPCSSIAMVTCDLALTSKVTLANRFLHFLDAPERLRNTALWINRANPYAK